MFCTVLSFTNYKFILINTELVYAHCWNLLSKIPCRDEVEATREPKEKYSFNVLVTLEKALEVTNQSLVTVQ